jgi:hypothetical protein
MFAVFTDSVYCGGAAETIVNARLFSVAAFAPPRPERYSLPPTVRPTFASQRHDGVRADGDVRHVRRRIRQRR